MKITNRQRVADYDRVKAHADKLELALHDMANGRLGDGLWYRFSEYEPFDLTDRDKMRIRCSWRTMPLFIVQYKVPANPPGHDRIEVYTESEISDLYRDHPTWPIARMLDAARATFTARHMAA